MFLGVTHQRASGVGYAVDARKYVIGNRRKRKQIE